jgi:hypothetical protein
MTTLKSRLAKLESAMTPPPLVFHIANFIVDPDNLTPMGYTCGDITIIRELGESDEALQKRCSKAVPWPDVTHRHIFEPLGDVCQ